jgi:hypothetical protein
LEADAVLAYQRAGLDPAEPVSTAKLARLLFGPDVIARLPGVLGTRPACTAWLHGQPRIVVKRNLTPEQVQHAVGHELAHLLLGRRCAAELSLELACDYLGAALIAPRPAVVAMHRALGLDVRAVAGELVVTQTCAALRLGEALTLPLAAIGPRVRVRGPEEHMWPDEPVLRRWATRPPKGLAKVRITDQPGRVLLVDDDVA